ncbi:hypothetical protein FA13DRAFT_335723 [Coprinellus micaceus]|uniref:Uncharacterized protein n=1 Tax=Coprinellus micaceus TaxID=71717 RepID=A0A4Y7TBR6_COPMI|nr:hypothetical protein FA13DRAFT_335723 [Coprinellus micaceus]
MPNASATPTRTRTRKRARPSESGEVAKRAVEALVTPSRNRKSRSPMRVDTQEEAAKVGDRGSEKKRRKVSPVKGVQEEEGVSGMEVEVAMPQGVPRRGRTRSTAGTEKVVLPANTATASTSAATIPATPARTRPNHRKRKSMSALDDIRRELAVTPALDEQATPPQSTRKKLRKSADVDSEGPAKGSTVTFAVDGKGKGREKERSPARGKRGSRGTKSTFASTSVDASVPMQDVEMADDLPAAAAPAPKLGRRKSMRKLAASTQESSTTVPSEDPISPLPSNPTPHTPLGAAAAILASTSNAATLSPSALTSPSSSPSAPARRFTRSSLAINTQDPAVALAVTSPLSNTRQLSPLSPPTSPLSTTSSLDLPLSPNQVASAQTQAKAPAKLVAEAAVAASSRSVGTNGSGSGRASAVLPTRRIATRSSGLPLIVAEWGVAAGSGRKRRTPSSPLAAVGSTVPESPEKDKAGTDQEVPAGEGSMKGKEKEKEVQTVRGGKGKGKAGRKRGGGVRVRRSSRLSGASELDSTPTTAVQPGPPPLRLSLASLSPPMPASAHKPHTRSPLSASSSHQGQHSGATSPLKEGSISPLKENASLSNIGSASSSVGLGNSAPTSSSPNTGDRPSNGKQSQGMQGSTKSMQSHTPPGSPTRASMAMQMEIDAVDFGTPLPGPMQFNSQIQTSPPHSSSQQQQGGSGAGKQVERPGSPTSPTERRIPLMPSTLLGVGAGPVRFDGDGVGEKADVGKEKERERAGVEEVESGKGVEEGPSIQQVELGGLVQLPASTISASSDVVTLASSEPVLDENTPLPQQPLYPALIQVEIPPAPQPLPPQAQLEQEQQQFGDSAQVYDWEIATSDDEEGFLVEEDGDECRG